MLILVLAPSGTTLLRRVVVCVLQPGRVWVPAARISVGGVIGAGGGCWGVEMSLRVRWGANGESNLCILIIIGD